MKYVLCTSDILEKAHPYPINYTIAEQKLVHLPATKTHVN